MKTITIRDFTNQAPYVNPTLAPQFTEVLKDIYIRQTRLQLVPSNGDLELEGEITGYDFAPMAVKEDAIASQTRLTITVPGFVTPTELTRRILSSRSPLTASSTVT